MQVDDGIAGTRKATGPGMRAGSAMIAGLVTVPADRLRPTTAGHDRLETHPASPSDQVREIDHPKRSPVVSDRPVNVGVRRPADPRGCHADERPVRRRSCTTVPAGAGDACSDSPAPARAHAFLDDFKDRHLIIAGRRSA